MESLLYVQWLEENRKDKGRHFLTIIKYLNTLSTYCFIYTFTDCTKLPITYFHYYFIDPVPPIFLLVWYYQGFPEKKVNLFFCTHFSDRLTSPVPTDSSLQSRRKCLVKVNVETNHKAWLFYTYIRTQL